MPRQYWSKYLPQAVVLVVHATLCIIRSGTGSIGVSCIFHEIGGLSDDRNAKVALCSQQKWLIDKTHLLSYQQYKCNNPLLQLYNKIKYNNYRSKTNIHTKFSSWLFHQPSEYKTIKRTDVCCSQQHIATALSLFNIIYPIFSFVLGFSSPSSSSSSLYPTPSPSTSLFSSYIVVVLGYTVRTFFSKTR